MTLMMWRTFCTRRYSWSGTDCGCVALLREIFNQTKTDKYNSILHTIIKQFIYSDTKITINHL